MQNIVFDFGGVIFRWEPERIVQAVECEEQIRTHLLENIFRHPKWLDFDRGTLTIDEIVQHTAQRTALPAPLIAQVIELVPVLMTPFPETIDLLYQIKSTGRRVYALSNMPEPSMTYFETHYNFLDAFDGMVISSRVHMIKPEPQIYHHLLQTYRLHPEETLFIDDVEVNLQAAAATGMQTLKFVSPSQCKEELTKLGIL